MFVSNDDNQTITFPTNPRRLLSTGTSSGYLQVAERERERLLSSYSCVSTPVFEKNVACKLGIVMLTVLSA